ncbi:zinc carboxypeptidase [Colletotrichum zoysiae]|uniref:Zinc carboxypeptidase n=1 Tax=Colletotrichum zoysiae TaxID=1216348 RepID=A0AAD9HFU5_9PEZI|nr:zinc carboxypeptidase [Colletotrichum zoysiae]
MKLISLSIAVIYLVATGASLSYDGYQVLRVRTGTRMAFIRQKLGTIKFDEWDTVRNKHIDIAVSPDQIEPFMKLSLDYHVMHKDLSRSIAEESAANEVWKRQVYDLSWYSSYHPYEDHKAYFKALHIAFPNNSNLVSSGTSHEGREIFGIHFWGANGPGQPAILWHGTVHAREWIVAPVLEYLTLQLIQCYGIDNATTGFVDKYDFWVFPIVNPDDSSGIKLYIDWHSYSQYLLAPVGFNCTYYIPTLGQHIALAQIASDSIREVEGVTFTYGPSCATLYPTTGGSFDYAHAVGKADWSYLIELRDTGDYGFILPAQQIKGSAAEQWEGMKAMLSLLDETFFDGAGDAAL